MHLQLHSFSVAKEPGSIKDPKTPLRMGAQKMSLCLKNHVTLPSVLYPPIISFAYRVKFEFLRLWTMPLSLTEFLPPSLTSSHTSCPWTQHCNHTVPVLWKLCCRHAPSSVYNTHLSFAHLVNFYSSSKLCSTTSSSMKASLSSQVETTFHSLVPPMYPIHTPFIASVTPFWTYL